MQNPPKSKPARLAREPRRIKNLPRLQQRSDTQVEPVAALKQRGADDVG
ncbi:hypothetical protein G8D25_06420 (plasmid) [Ralstonia solanacearum]|nr:hypothetical protein [Ralstonia solanacearum]QJC22752.1 hypothetical protein G8D25_06420 [Ralstonia solanacearum]